MILKLVCFPGFFVNSNKSTIGEYELFYYHQHGTYVNEILSSTWWLGFGFCICHLANEDTIFRMLRVIHFIHIWWCYCKCSPVIAEGKWCDAGGVPMELAQSLFVKWIPNIYKSIRTTCGECIVNVMKGNGIDRVNLLNVVFSQPVALEGILLLLHLRAWVQVLNCHSAFNGA